MPVLILQGDITTLPVDAIVNAANASLLGGGGVDGCIHRAAGPELLEECRTLGGCETGKAKLTKGYRLPCRYIVHTVGPIWHGGDRGEEALLTSCYDTSLQLAYDHGCRSVAFPLISAGVYGYPKHQALQVALDAMHRFTEAHDDLTAVLVIYNKRDFQPDRQQLDAVRVYVRSHLKEPRRRPRMSYPLADVCAEERLRDSGLPPAPADLARALGQLDESFQEMLLRKIDESGMTDAQCYKKANIDRKLFSKIRSDRLYRPSKATALAFAVALELPLEEARELLCKAGFAFSHASKFDVIVEYFIQCGCYDLMQINQMLFAFDQSLLGG